MEAPLPESTLRGRVKWFNVLKGYGFVLDEQGREFFVHFTMIAKDGYRALRDGDVVEFAPHDGPKGLAAHQVRRIKPSTDLELRPLNGHTLDGQIIRARARTLLATLNTPSRRHRAERHQLHATQPSGAHPSFVASAAANFQEFSGLPSGTEIRT